MLIIDRALSATNESAKMKSIKISEIGIFRETLRRKIIVKRKKNKKKQKSSSWGGVLKSYLKEFLLGNNMLDVYDCDLEDDENLTKEGKRKKNLLGAAAWILAGLYLGVLPFRNWENGIEHPIVIVIIESMAVGTLILGVLKLKKA